jgi:hypothetical protein
MKFDNTYGIQRQNLVRPKAKKISKAGEDESEGFIYKFKFVLD